MHDDGVVLVSLQLYIPGDLPGLIVDMVIVTFSVPEEFAAFGKRSGILIGKFIERKAVFHPVVLHLFSIIDNCVGSELHGVALSSDINPPFINSVLVTLNFFVEGYIPGIGEVILLPAVLLHLHSALDEEHSVRIL